LFSAKANRVKKMAALSSHIKYFIELLCAHSRLGVQRRA
jgi:hypothetical protein